MNVSVVLCTYNGAQYLPAQLDSIRRQTRAIDELVVGDDGSTDATRDIIDAFAQSSGLHVRVLETGARLGPTRNFERAIRAATGDVIFLSDQDDAWLSDKVATMLELFCAGPHVGCVLSDARIVDASLRDLGASLWQKVGFVPSAERLATREIRSALLQKTIAFGTTMAFRASLREHALPISMPFGHDSWVALVAAAVSRVALVRRPLTLYRQHGAQASGGAPARSLRGLVSPSAQGAQSPVASTLSELADRLEPLRGVAADPSAFDQVIEDLRMKAAHLRVRARLPRAPLERVAAVARESAGLGYHRYSNGLRSAVADVLHGRRPELE